MAYGDKHKLSHRPMYPEFPFRKPVYRNLYYLERGKVYDRTGKLVSKPDDAEELTTFMRDSIGCIFVPGIVQPEFSCQYLPGFAFMENADILATKVGKPILVRVRCGRSTRWVSSLENWNEVPEPECLDRMWDVYEHIGVGYAPTKSSLGKAFARDIYTSRRLSKHTSPSIACETFIREHSVGQGVSTQGLGYYSVLRFMDIHAAFLKYFTIHPTGTAVRRLTEDNNLATYFARCTVTVWNTLPLGPFPQRVKRDGRTKVMYPVEPGLYHDIYISKEQVEDCRRAGCTVDVHGGFGWAEFTTDNMYFCQEAYWKRTIAHPDHVERASKAAPLAAMGAHAQPRERYNLIDISRARPGERIVVSEEGEPLQYALRKEIDVYGSRMIHWWWYTVTECNRAVYNFALPYAIAGRLIMIDYDSVMVLDGEDRDMYYKRHSLEEVFAQAGDWKWQLLHNVNVLGDRTFESEEMTRKPGVKRGVA
jgi:hypothetical protein